MEKQGRWMRRAREKKSLPQVLTAPLPKGSVGSCSPTLRCTHNEKWYIVQKHDLVSLFPVASSWPGAFLTNSFCAQRMSDTCWNRAGLFFKHIPLSGCRAAGTLRGWSCQLPKRSKFQHKAELVGRWVGMQAGGSKATWAWNAGGGEWRWGWAKRAFVIKHN